MEDPQAAIDPLGDPAFFARVHTSEIHVPEVNVPLLQATEITNGYFPLFVALLMCELP